MNMASINNNSVYKFAEHHRLIYHVTNQFTTPHYHLQFQISNKFFTNNEMTATFTAINGTELLLVGNCQSLKVDLYSSVISVFQSARESTETRSFAYIYVQ